MVDEISLIGWRNDIGAYLIMQYPRKLKLDTQEIMQIYTAHRQNTLLPNFTTLKYMGKIKIASYFSGMETTEYIAAPNFIISVYLDEAEPPSIFRDLLPDISKKILTNLFDRLPIILKRLEVVKGFVILTKEQDIGVFPVLLFPESKISSKMKSDIFKAHFKPSKIVKKCAFEIDGNKFASFYTGNENEDYIITPNFIVTFFLKEQADLTSFKKKLTKHTKLILNEIYYLLAEGLEQCNKQIVEWIIKDELKERPIIGEKDFEHLSLFNDEPDVIGETTESISLQNLENEEIQILEKEKVIDQMLEQIKMKTQIKALEIEEKIDYKDFQPDFSAPKEELTNQIKFLQEQIHHRDDIIINLNEEIENLNQNLKEKDQNIKKLLLIIKSLKKHVGY